MAVQGVETCVILRALGITWYTFNLCRVWAGDRFPVPKRVGVSYIWPESSIDTVAKLLAEHREFSAKRKVAQA